MTEDLASIQATGTTNTTGATISNGTYFYLNGTLVQATANIASGATFTSGTNYAAVTAGALNALKSALSTFVRPNLLDNPYFIGGGSQQGGGQFPINQRGQSVYTGANIDTIDRWFTSVANTITVGNDYLEIAVGYLSQKIENWEWLIGKTVTLSALVKGSGNIYIYNIGVSDSAKALFSTNDYTLASVTVTIPSVSQTGEQIVITSNNTVDIRAIKLELGDTQTLAREVNGQWVLNDPPPNYQQELAKCQWYYRYFEKIDIPCSNNGGDANVRGTLPISMRGVTSSSFTIGYFFYDSTNYFGVQNVVVNAYNSVAEIHATLSGNVPTNSNGVLYLQGLKINADL